LATISSEPGDPSIQSRVAHHSFHDAAIEDGQRRPLRGRLERKDDRRLVDLLVIAVLK
jgi:hypothetical protein